MKAERLAELIRVLYYSKPSDSRFAEQGNPVSATSEICGEFVRLNSRIKELEKENAKLKDGYVEKKELKVIDYLKHTDRETPMRHLLVTNFSVPVSANFGYPDICRYSYIDKHWCILNGQKTSPHKYWTYLNECFYD